MNNVFKNIVEINWYHINNSFVIPIPKKIHRSASSYSQNKHRLSIENHWIYKFLNIDKLIKEF